MAHDVVVRVNNTAKKREIFEDFAKFESTERNSMVSNHRTSGIVEKSTIEDAVGEIKNILARYYQGNWDSLIYLKYFCCICLRLKPTSNFATIQLTIEKHLDFIVSEYEEIKVKHLIHLRLDYVQIGYITF